MEWQLVIKELRDLGLPVELIAVRTGVKSNAVYCWANGTRFPSEKHQEKLTKLLEDTKNSLAAGKRVRYLRPTEGASYESNASSLGGDPRAEPGNHSKELGSV